MLSAFLLSRQRRKLTLRPNHLRRMLCQSSRHHRPKDNSKIGIETARPKIGRDHGDAVILLNAPITIAGTYTGNPFQFRTGSEANNPLGLCAQKSFTYGSGGTSVDTFLQTSLDGGNSWCD